MADRTSSLERQNAAAPVGNPAADELQIEEFSIVELEDRLEFLDRCNPNCSCGPQVPSVPTT